MKQIFDEIGGTAVYAIAGGGIIGIFWMLLERLIG